MGNAGFKIIGHQYFGNAVEEFKGTDVGANPIRQALRSAGFGKGVIAGSQGRNKNLRVALQCAAFRDIGYSWVQDNLKRYCFRRRQSALIFSPQYAAFGEIAACGGCETA